MADQASSSSSLASSSTTASLLYDHEAERAALVALATQSQLDPGQALVGLDSVGLVESDFHSLDYRRLFVAMAAVIRRQEPADPVTIPPELGRAGCSVPKELVLDVLLDSGVGGLAGLQAYARQIRDLGDRRHLAGVLRDALGAVTDRRRTVGDIANTVAGLQAVRGRETRAVVPLDKVTGRVVETIEQARAGSGVSVRFIPSGIRPLDESIGGLQPTLTLVGALPGVGKSAFLGTIAQLAAINGRRVGIISLEDEPSWLAYRIISHESGVDQFEMRFRRLNEDAYQSVGQGVTRLLQYSGRILTVDGSESGMTLDQVISASHDLILNHKAEVIILDHLGEITAPTSAFGDRYDLEVSRQLSRLRGIANRYGVPMVVAMHLRRREGLGPGNVPRLSDFANSSGAERKARVALCLSREPDSDILNVHVLKNTNGKAGGTVQLRFVGGAAMVREMERGPRRAV